MLNDHKINRISLFFSIIIHVGLVIFSLIMLSNPIEISHDLPPVPIEFSIKEIIIEKTVSKPTIQKPPPISKPSKAPPAKPKDDRKKPLLESHKDPYYPKEAINFSL